MVRRSRLQTLLFLGPKLSSRVRLRLRLCLQLQFLISRRCRVPFSSDLHFTSSYRLPTTSLETTLQSLVHASRDTIERLIAPSSQRAHEGCLISRTSIIATQDPSSPCRPNATSSVPQSHPHALFKTPPFWHDFFTSLSRMVIRSGGLLQDGSAASVSQRQEACQGI